MFIDRLNEALKKNKMTGNALCNKMGVSNSIYSSWKKNKPQADRLTQIANILNVSVDWLLEREGASTPEEEKLLHDYKDTDEGGKRIILNIADMEAKRSRSERESLDETQNTPAKKINFVDLAVKQNLSYQGKEDQEDDEELKPFA